MKLRKYIIYTGFILNFFLHGEVFDGYTLFTPKSAQEDGASTHLMNNDYDIMHSWSHDQGPASMPYLLPDSSIIYPYRVPNPTMDAGGVGGGIEKQTWDGEILWDYTFSDDLTSIIMMLSLFQMEISLSLYGRKRRRRKLMIWAGKPFPTH